MRSGSTSVRAISRSTVTDRTSANQWPGASPSSSAERGTDRPAWIGRTGAECLDAVRFGNLFGEHGERVRLVEALGGEILEADQEASVVEIAPRVELGEWYPILNQPVLLRLDHGEIPR